MTKRLSLDAYYTPDVVADAIVKDLLEHGSIGSLPLDRDYFRMLEPSVGKGAFVRAVAKHLPLNMPAFFSMVDLEEHPELEGETFKVIDARASLIHTSRTFARHDFLDFDDPVGFDLVIGNPPFGSAEQHIRAALRQTRYGGTCAMLLRLSILESWERANGLWKEHVPDEIVCLDGRPSFAHGGNDSVGYCVVVWNVRKQRKKHVTTFRWLRWAPTPRRVLAREKKSLPSE